MKKSVWLIVASCLLLVAVASIAQAGEKSDKEKMEGEKTIQGCLSDGPADGWYVLTKKKDEGTKEIRVEGDDSFEAHIGHEVKLTGEWKKGEDGSKHFHAGGMEHVSTDCS
jgi:hypothetical protein